MVLTGVNRKILDAASPQLCRGANPLDLLPLLSMTITSDAARAQIIHATETKGPTFGMLSLLSAYQRSAIDLESLKSALLSLDIDIDLTEKVAAGSSVSRATRSDEIDELRQQVRDAALFLTDHSSRFNFLQQQFRDVQRENKAKIEHIMEKQNAFEQTMRELTHRATTSNSDTKTMLEKMNENLNDFFTEQRSIAAETNAGLDRDIAESEAAIQQEAQSRAAAIFDGRKIHGLILESDPVLLACSLPEECLPGPDKEAVKNTKLDGRLGSAAASCRLIDGIKRSLIGQEDRSVQAQLNSIVGAWEPVAGAQLITSLKEAIRRL